PASLRARAVAAPIPRLPPVTTANLVIPSPQRFPEQPLCGRLPFHTQGNAHAAANAQGGKTFTGITAAHLEKQGRQHARPGRTNWVTDGDRASVHIDDVRVPA